jgi:hypothetical protein
MDPEQCHQFLGRWTFFLMGISAMIGWNSILTSLDFFYTFYETFCDVYFNLPLPYFLGCVSTALLNAVLLDQKITVLSRLWGGFLTSGVMLIILPIEALTLPPLLGFILTLFLLSLFGCGSYIATVASIVLAAPFEKENYTTLYATGCGVAGILVGLLRMVILAIFDNTKTGNIVGTFFLFTIAVIIILETLLQVKLFTKTNFVHPKN